MATNPSSPQDNKNRRTVSRIAAIRIANIARIYVPCRKQFDWAARFSERIKQSKSPGCVGAILFAME